MDSKKRNKINNYIHQDTTSRLGWLCIVYKKPLTASQWKEREYPGKRSCDCSRKSYAQCLCEHKGNLCQKERGKGKRRGGRERKRLSIFTQMDPLWLMKQVETFEQTGARKARNIYTKGLFNVSRRCYQGPLHLRLHVLQYKNRSVWQKVIFIESIYITGCLFSGF